MINFGARPVETLLGNMMSWTLMLFTTTSPISRVFLKQRKYNFVVHPERLACQGGGCISSSGTAVLSMCLCSATYALLLGGLLRLSSHFCVLAMESADFSLPAS